MLAYEQILKFTRKLTLVHDSNVTPVGTIANSRTEMMLTIVSGSLAGMRRMNYVLTVEFCHRQPVKTVHRATVMGRCYSI